MKTINVGQKIWLTKYALTEGIVLVKVESTYDDSTVRVQGRAAYYKVGKDVHLTKDDARAAANKMRDKKVLSLRKQLTAVEKMVF